MRAPSLLRLPMLYVSQTRHPLFSFIGATHARFGESYQIAGKTIKTDEQFRILFQS